MKQLVQFVVFLILARFIGPAEYGLASIVGSIGILASAITDAGVPAALIRKRDLTNEYRASAFWISASIGVVMSVVLWFLAPTIAEVFGSNELVRLVRVSCAVFLLAPGALSLALLERNLRFGPVAITDIAASSCSGAIAIAMAIHGLGAVSVAAMPVTYGITVWIVASLFGGRSFPLRGSVKDAREVWSFGRHLLAFNAVNFGFRNGDTLALGYASSKVELGLYTRAYTIMMLPIQLVASVVARVLFPTLAGRRSAGRDIWPSWVEGVGLSMRLGLPMAGLLVSCSGLVVSVLLGESWSAAGPILAILSWGIPPQFISKNFGPAYQVLGQTKRQFKLGLISTSFMLVFVAIGLFWGAIGVATGVTVALWVSAAFTLIDVTRMLSGKLRDLLADLWRSSLSFILCCLFGLALANSSILSFSPILKLALVAMGISLLHILILAVLRDRMTLLGGALLLRLVSRRSRSSVGSGEG